MCAAVTSSIVALGGLGLSAGQAISAQKDKKEAQRAASVARNQLESIKAENKYKALQAPDVSKLAFERNARNTADMVGALREMGPEGAAQASRIEEVSRASNLAAAEKQSAAEFSRDKIVAEQDQRIEDARVGRETAVAWGSLEGASQAERDAEDRRNAAISNAVGSAGALATGIGSATSLEAEAQRNKRRGSATDPGAAGVKGAGGGARSMSDRVPGVESESIFNQDGMYGGWDFLKGIQNQYR